MKKIKWAVLEAFDLSMLFSWLALGFIFDWRWLFVGIRRSFRNLMRGW